MSLAAYLNQVADFGTSIHDNKTSADWRYQSYEELVLDRGTLWTTARLDVSGPIKECFTNAWHAAWDNRNNGWVYVEGYANSIIPVAHAWCLDGEGVVVETTWEKVGSEYYGIPLRTEWVMEVTAETGYWGVFGNDWMRDLPILREGLPNEAQVGGIPAIITTD